MNRPTKTAEDVLALPEKDFMTMRKVVQDDGTFMNYPVIEKTSVTPYEMDDIMVAFDEKGWGWQPVLHEDVWYKQRVPMFT